MPINNNICPNCGEMNAYPSKKQLNPAICAAGAVLVTLALLIKIIYYIMYNNSGVVGTSTMYALLNFFGIKISIFMILDILLFAAILAGFVLLRKQPLVLAVSCCTYAVVEVGLEIYTIVIIVTEHSGMLSVSYILTRMLTLLTYIGIALVAAALFAKNDTRKALAIAAACCLGISILRNGFGFNYLLLGSMLAFLTLSSLAAVLIQIALLIAAVGIAVSTKKTEKNRQY